MITRRPERLAATYLITDILVGRRIAALVLHTPD